MNRSEQNRALRELDALVNTVKEFDPLAREAIMRGRFSSGQRRHFKGELGEMDGTPGPHYSDPTGDDAVWDEIRDTTGKIISDMATAIGQWRVMAQWIKNLSNTDVVARAERTIPDCMACGDPCLGRVQGGFDEKCYWRWKREGRPDRVKFIADVRKERDAEAAANSASEQGV